MYLVANVDVQDVRWLDLRVGNLKEVSLVLIINKVFKFNTIKLLKLLKRKEFLKVVSISIQLCMSLNF